MQLRIYFWHKLLIDLQIFIFEHIEDHFHLNLAEALIPLLIVSAGAAELSKNNLEKA